MSVHAGDQAVESCSAVGVQCSRYYPTFLEHSFIHCWSPKHYRPNEKLLFNDQIRLDTPKWERSSGEGSGHYCGQQVGHEPAVCPCGTWGSLKRAGAAGRGS